MPIEPIPTIFSKVDKGISKNKNFSIQISTEFKDGRTYTVKTYTNEYGILWKIGRGIAAFFATLGTAFIGAIVMDSIKNLWREALSGKRVCIIKEEKKTSQANDIEGIFQKTHQNSPLTPLSTNDQPLQMQPQLFPDQGSQNAADLLSKQNHQGSNPKTVANSSISEEKILPTNSNTNSANNGLPLSKKEAEEILQAVFKLDSNRKDGPNEIEFVQLIYKELHELALLCEKIDYNFRDNRATLDDFSDSHVIQVKYPDFDPGKGPLDLISFRFMGTNGNYTEISNFLDSSGKPRRLNMAGERHKHCVVELINRKFKGIFKDPCPDTRNSYGSFVLVQKPVKLQARQLPDQGSQNVNNSDSQPIAQGEIAQSLRINNFENMKTLSDDQAKDVLKAVPIYQGNYNYDHYDIEFLQLIYKDLQEVVSFCKKLDYNFKDQEKEFENFNKRHFIQIKLSDKKTNVIRFKFNGKDTGFTEIEGFTNQLGKPHLLHMTELRHNRCTEELIKKYFKGLLEEASPSTNSYSKFTVIRPN